MHLNLMAHAESSMIDAIVKILKEEICHIRIAFTMCQLSNYIQFVTQLAHFTVINTCMSIAINYVPHSS